VGEDAEAVAWLHDVVEDTGVTRGQIDSTSTRVPA
jgi:(p)ppGpp synthase/HD superfamily hydrolase